MSVISVRVVKGSVQNVYSLLKKNIEADAFELIGREGEWAAFSGFLINNHVIKIDLRYLLMYKKTPTRDEIKKELKHIVSKIEAGSSPPPKRTCTTCRQVTSKKCSVCRSEYYCSVDCQTVDWASHRAACQVVKAWRSQKCCREKCNKPLEDIGGVLCVFCKCVIYCDMHCRKKDLAHKKSGLCYKLQHTISVENTSDVLKSFSRMKICRK